MEKVRKRQEERRDETSAKLRAATISLIADRGYVNTTTTEISKKAGVSRGALLHHYPAKIDLIVDAAAQVYARRLSRCRHFQARLDVASWILTGLWKASGTGCSSIIQ
ncbi:MAG: TetR/AcrR family transcriptional regulator [Pseudomonadota bacterium]